MRERGRVKKELEREASVEEKFTERMRAWKRKEKNSKRMRKWKKK